METRVLDESPHVVWDGRVVKSDAVTENLVQRRKEGVPILDCRTNRRYGLREGLKEVHTRGDGRGHCAGRCLGCRHAENRVAEPTQHPIHEVRDVRLD